VVRLSWSKLAEGVVAKLGEGIKNSTPHLLITISIKRSFP
jgi:hypothetical protein